MKKFLAILTALIMVIGLMPAALATGDGVIDTEAELRDAITAGGDVMVAGDITLTGDAITVAADVTVKADAAVTITADGVEDAFIVTGGTLTLGENITVSSDTSILWANGGDIVVDGAVLSAVNSPYAVAVANNGGSITVADGSIAGSGSDHVTLVAGTDGEVFVTGGEVTSADSSALLAKDGGEATVSGGIVETTCEDPAFCAAFARGTGKVIVDGGTVRSAAGAGVVAVTDGIVEISGGTVQAGEGNVSVKAHENSAATATITGGTFIGGLATNNDATLTVSGGTFDTDPSDYLTDGYEAVESDGAWTVQEVTGGESGDVGGDGSGGDTGSSEPEVRIFSDVLDGTPFMREIEWGYQAGYLKGITADSYKPFDPISRQQVWLILARRAGAAPADMTAAKEWAIANGISDGSDPGAAITRQQMVTMLYRFAAFEGFVAAARADLSAYPDGASVADYAAEAMQWAVGCGHVQGTNAGTLDPNGSTTRGQFAALLFRYVF